VPPPSVQAVEAQKRQMEMRQQAVSQQRQQEYNTSAWSVGGNIGGDGMADDADVAVGRGRGRGRGICNVPAWMEQGQSQSQSQPQIQPPSQQTPPLVVIDMHNIGLTYINTLEVAGVDVVTHTDSLALEGAILANKYFQSAGCNTLMVVPDEYKDIWEKSYGNSIDFLSNGTSEYSDFLVATIGSSLSPDGTFLLSNGRFVSERSSLSGFNDFLQNGVEMRPELGGGKISANFDFDESDRLVFQPDKKHILVKEIEKSKSRM